MKWGKEEIIKREDNLEWMRKRGNDDEIIELHWLGKKERKTRISEESKNSCERSRIQEGWNMRSAKRECIYIYK